jgi:hypothetical protein
MCFGGTKTPVQQSTPVVVPAPSVASASTPVETESSVADKKRKQIASYQSGLASTIKTSAQGDTGSVNLLAPAATDAKKTKLGQ